MNVLEAAQAVGTKVVFSSTCKACDPETAYGATKLIAERLVLNAGGVVVRYYNIPESDGNVFRLWESLPASEPIPYTDCWRYFNAMEDVLDLTLAAADLAPGRYTVNPGLPRHMSIVARDLYPDRELVEIPRRRGDRYREPLKAQCEDMWPVADSPYVAIYSEYDAWRRTPLPVPIGAA
jgi:FlaA1/EpsC-like NDP-sugar epimerase